MYQHILFDLDGTLTDPKVGITSAVAHALKFYGIEVENLDTLCKFIGPPLADSFMEYYGFDREQAVEAVEKYREYFSVRGLYENEVYPGIEQLLKALTEHPMHRSVIWLWKPARAGRSGSGNDQRERRRTARHLSVTEGKIAPEKPQRKKK